MQFDARYCSTCWTRLSAWGDLPSFKRKFAASFIRIFSFIRICDMGWIRTEIYDSLVPGWSVAGLGTWCQDHQGLDLRLSTRF